MIRFCILLLATILSVQTKAQWGCPDPQAINYSASATQNDGSCLYNTTAYTLPVRDTLDPLLYEVSGILCRNGKLYVHNDGGSTNAVYEMDTTLGLITKTITLGTKTNIDWEDIAQSPTHIFIGDFGNNLGIRQNLVIYKFPASVLSQPGASITVPDAQIEMISFVYPDQTNFSSNAQTRFDCEAMAWRNNRLHLFSKNHGGGACYHYRLPDTAGSYTATLLDSFDTQQFEITAADFADNQQLMLIGYQTVVPANCALWFVYDFSSEDSCFARGNKRRIDLNSALVNGQVEGICFSDTSGGFVCNERFTHPQLPGVDIPNRLYRFSTSAWYPYVYPNGVQEVEESGLGYSVSGRHIRILRPGTLDVFSMSGQFVQQVTAPEGHLHTTPGTYIFRWQEKGVKTISTLRVIE